MLKRSRVSAGDLLVKITSKVVEQKKQNDNGKRSGKND